jgi:hypothetical protein
MLYFMSRHAECESADLAAEAAKPQQIKSWAITSTNVCAQDILFCTQISKGS